LPGLATDSAPIMKAWAEKAGVGSRGKNSLIINPKIGSFIFIGEIITDLELEYDTAEIRDICANCTRCIDACPTGAIIAPRQLDPRKCISYFTLEYVGELPENKKKQFDDRIYGCDTCQDVCPWNRRAVPSTEISFNLNPGLKDMNKEKWAKLTEDQFNAIFKNSSVKRRKFKGLIRNIRFLKDVV
jgi:epoxyqueuosine reductase